MFTKWRELRADRRKNKKKTKLLFTQNDKRGKTTIVLQKKTTFLFSNRCYDRIFSYNCVEYIDHNNKTSNCAFLLQFELEWKQRRHIKLLQVIFCFLEWKWKNIHLIGESFWVFQCLLLIRSVCLRFLWNQNVSLDTEEKRTILEASKFFWICHPNSYWAAWCNNKSFELKLLFEP